MFGRSKNKVKRKNGYSRWKKAGIIFLCLIAGLAVGGVAGFMIQREFKSTKADKAAEPKPEAEKDAKETTTGETEAGAESTVPAASTVPSIPQVTGSSPAEAIRAFLEALGMDSGGMMFSVVSASKADANWKLDKGVISGQEPIFFIVHYVSGGWTVVDYGTVMTADQIKAAGAPSDLKPPD
ncbi:MAG: hypothetical protein JW738_04190 [Actinobacteria bacterium]|nr:hypothetical protein [Actinomycetota bacterium]